MSAFEVTIRCRDLQEVMRMFDFTEIPEIARVVECFPDGRKIDESENIACDLVFDASMNGWSSDLAQEFCEAMGVLPTESDRPAAQEHGLRAVHLGVGAAA